MLKNEALDLFAAQSGTGLANLLGAFGFSAYTDFYSEQNDTVRVFVDDASTLRLAKTGLMQYATAGDQSTVTAFESGEVTGSAALDAQIDCARVILDTVLRAGETDTHASLYAVNETEHRTTLVFLQLYSGVPVLGSTDFAAFEFEGGVLRAATVNLQRFAATGEAGGGERLGGRAQHDGGLPRGKRRLCALALLSEGRKNGLNGGETACSGTR